MLSAAGARAGRRQRARAGRSRASSATASGMRQRVDLGQADLQRVVAEDVRDRAVEVAPARARRGSGRAASRTTRRAWLTCRRPAPKMRSMPSIIPLAAFSDNYVWAIRAGDRVAVVDPGDAAPVAAFLARERVALVAIVVTHHHPDHTGGIDDARATRTRAGDRPGAGDDPAAHAGGRRRRRVVLPGIGLPLEVIDIPGHTVGPRRVRGRGRGLGLAGAVLRRHAVRGRLRAPVRGHAGADARVAVRGSPRCPPTRGSICGHEYTLANLRFAAAVEPSNAAIADRTARMAALRERGPADAAVDARRRSGRRTRSCVRASPRCGRSPRRAKGGSSTIRSRCSPRSGLEERVLTRTPRSGCAAGPRPRRLHGPRGTPTPSDAGSELGVTETTFCDEVLVPIVLACAGARSGPRPRRSERGRVPLPRRRAAAAARSP